MVKSVRELFLNDGVDEQVLTDLKEVKFLLFKNILLFDFIDLSHGLMVYSLPKWLGVNKNWYVFCIKSNLMLLVFTVKDTSLLEYSNPQSNNSH